MSARTAAGRMAGVLAALSVALLVAAVGAASSRWTTYVEASAGFRISAPSNWQEVPHSLAAVKARIEKLDSELDSGLAEVYESLISSAAGRAALSRYAFSAFLYPPTSDVQTDVSVSVVHSTTAYASGGLPALASMTAQQFEASIGTKVSESKVVDLPAGKAALVEGSEPGQGVTIGFAVYLIPRGRMLYELSFLAVRTGSKALSDAATVKAIARSFTFS